MSSSFHAAGHYANILADAAAKLNDEAVYSDAYLLATVDYSREAFAHYPEYSGDVPGRWILAMVLLEQCGLPQPRLHRVVGEILQYQQPDGAFRRPAQPLSATNRAQIYGNGWMLQGLAAYAAHTGDAAVLDAAVKLGEYYLNTAPYWFTEAEKNRPVTYGHAYGCHSHALAGICALYRLIKDEKILRFAERMADWADDFGRSCHSHMHLSTLRGMLDLYELNHDEKLLNKVTTELAEVSATSTLPGGGVYECYHIHHIDEECSTADYLLCNLKLWHLTGDMQYRDRVEAIYRNYHQYARMNCGLWGSSPVTDEVLQKSDNPAYWCCAMFGAYIQGIVPLRSIRHTEQGLWLDFIFPGSHPELRIETTFPFDDAVKLTVLNRNKLFIVAPNHARLSVDGVICEEKIVEFDATAGQQFEIKIIRRLSVQHKNTVNEQNGDYKLLQDGQFYYGPELLACSSPLLKRRGHFITLALDADGEYRFYEPLDGKFTELQTALSAVNRVCFMRITGNPFPGNLSSAADIYRTTLTPLAQCGSAPCKAIMDAVLINEKFIR